MTSQQVEKPTKFVKSRTLAEERAKRLMLRFLKYLQDNNRKYTAKYFIHEKLCAISERDTKAFYKYMSIYLADFASKLIGQMYESEVKTAINEFMLTNT